MFSGLIIENSQINPGFGISGIQSRRLSVGHDRLIGHAQILGGFSQGIQVGGIGAVAADRLAGHLKSVLIVLDLQQNNREIIEGVCVPGLQIQSLFIGLPGGLVIPFWK